MNFTQPPYFTLGAYFDTGRLRPFCFLVVMSLYAVTLGANLLLIAVICANRSLHEPMYVFLCSLFANQVLGSTGLLPLILVQLLADVHAVRAPFCFLQIFVLYVYGNVQLSNLAAMAYDRYLAICFPLQYNAFMTWGKVRRLLAVVWLYPVVEVAALISLSAPLQLCGTVIPKVYCDNYYIVKLACGDTTANNVFGIVYMFTVVVSVIGLILYSYVRILKVCFSGCRRTRQKALGTCAPHLASLLNFSFGCFFEILQSRFDVSGVPPALRVFLSLYWLTCQPLLNPLLYGLQFSKLRTLWRSPLSGRGA